MTKALRVQIKVPGQYRDIWLYKSRLFLWTRRGEMLYVDLASVAKSLIAKHGAAVGALVQTLIFRNDWKVGEQLRELTRIPAVESAFLQPFSRHENVIVELPLNLFHVSGSEEYPNAVLDTFIYADHLYLATRDGLLESYINSKHPDRPYDLNRQAEFRASRLSVKYAAINASAEDQGLHFARVNFGGPEDKGPGFKLANWRQIAAYSLSSSFAARNLLNYTDESVPSLHRSKVEEGRTHERARYEEQQVIGYEEPQDIGLLAYSALSRATNIRSENIDPDNSGNNEEFTVLGNSNYHLLASWSGRLRVVDLRAFNTGEVEARPSPSFAKAELLPVAPHEVLETYPLSGGFVVELFDSVRLITQDGSYPLLDGQVARLRTYVNSLRYREAVGVVQEDETSLLGFYVAEEVTF